jgi:hypothetical protein
MGKVTDLRSLWLDPCQLARRQFQRTPASPTSLCGNVYFRHDFVAVIHRAHGNNEYANTLPGVFLYCWVGAESIAPKNPLQLAPKRSFLPFSSKKVF